MKKILAFAMAIVMMMAVAVPAFATDITKADTDAANPASATADVVTKDTKEDGTDAYSYTISFPASTTVGWNDSSAKDVAYTVTSQLLLGASLKVSVAANDGGKMTNAGTEKYLTYTLTGAETATFGEVNNGAKASDVGGTNATVAIASFADVPVAEYTGTLTYTVEYVAPTTA